MIKLLQIIVKAKQNILILETFQPEQSAIKFKFYNATGCNLTGLTEEEVLFGLFEQVLISTCRAWRHGGSGNLVRIVEEMSLPLDIKSMIQKEKTKLGNGRPNARRSSHHDRDN